MAVRDLTQEAPSSDTRQAAPASGITSSVAERPTFQTAPYRQLPIRSALTYRLQCALLTESGHCLVSEDSLHGSAPHVAHGWVAGAVVPGSSHGLLESPCLSSFPFEFITAEVFSE